MLFLGLRVPYGVVVKVLGLETEKPPIKSQLAAPNDKSMHW